MPDRQTVLTVFVIGLAACSSDGSGPVEPGVTVGDVLLPVVGAVYRGATPHRFLDEQVTLFCGTHGVFSSAVAPPEQIGTSVLSEYTASFVGELVLSPPVVSRAVTHALSVQARMAERITLVEEREGVRTFDVELVTFELGGTGMPTDVMVRESPEAGSTGVTTITPVAGGGNRVETSYDVWLDISLDGGRSWHRAAQSVRMTLEPR